MADTKISALPSKATPVNADTLPIVDSVGTTNKKITIGTLPVSTATQTAIDAKVADAITDGVTTVAPSQNAVFDALALKENVANKATNLSSPDNTKYPTTQAVVTRFNAENSEYFGGGFDGDVTITGNVTLVRDMYYNNLTISGVGNIQTAGYRIFVAEVFTPSGSFTSGKIYRNGNAGGSATSGAGGGGAGGLNTAWFGGSTGSQNGGAGGSGASPGGNAVTNTGNTGNLGGDPGSSGNGGAGTTTAGGVSAASSTISAANSIINNRYADFFFRNSAYINGGVGAQGGSGGGGGSNIGGGGGGGGGGGAIIWLSARTIDVSSASGIILSARGGPAGNGANVAGAGGGGGGGGAGGGGGYCFCAYKNLIGSYSTFIDVSGGNGGNGGTSQPGTLGGEGGGSGGGGQATLVNIETGIVTMLTKIAPVAKVPNVGQTGGAGAVATTHQLGIS
jgi:hypothetical protein